MNSQNLTAMHGGRRAAISLLVIEGQDAVDCVPDNTPYFCYLGFDFHVPQITLHDRTGIYLHFGFRLQCPGGGGGGGRGGGGSVKPLTIRWVGTITAIAPKADGAVVTLGTSYYAVGTGTVDSSTKIKLNGTSSGVTGGDLRLGDVAQMDVLWPSRVVVKNGSDRGSLARVDVGICEPLLMYVCTDRETQLNFPSIHAIAFLAETGKSLFWQDGSHWKMPGRSILNHSQQSPRDSDATANGHNWPRWKKRCSMWHSVGICVDVERNSGVRFF